MTLRSGTSIWESQSLAPAEAQSLTGDAECEVAVIGSGVTGALVAGFMTEAGVDTLLIDKHALGSGSTAASTGLLQYEIDTPLAELIKRVGEADAVHAYRRGLEAIAEIEALIQTLDDRCGFARRDSLYFASHAWHRRRLRREFDCRARHGFAVGWLDREELAQMSSIRASGAIRSHGDAMLDPVRFTGAVLRRAVARGLRAFPHTPAIDIDERHDGATIHTPHARIRAARVVYATGYDAQTMLPEHGATLHSTYAVASAPQGKWIGWPDGALIWETARPYFYARQTQDGRAIIGGGDTAFRSDHRLDALVDFKVSRLQRRFQKLFPEASFEPACAWAGTFGESRDGLAYIGAMSDRPNAFFALGYGGNGITFSVIAARTIVDVHRGRKNRDAEVFRFDR